MFDRFHPARVRTQELLASAARMRVERTLRADALPTAAKTVASNLEVARDLPSDCSPECVPAVPNAARTHAA